MSSDIFQELSKLNNGHIVTFHKDSKTDLYARKILELTGIIQIGIFCYICNEISTHDYYVNDIKYRICDMCLDRLENASTNKTTYVYKNNKFYYCGYGSWLQSENYSNSFYKGEYIFICRLKPEEMLKIALLCKEKCNLSNHKCNNCHCHISSMYYYCYSEDTVACCGCRRKAEIYFDMDAMFYWYLKMIFCQNNDIARYIVLLYFKIKLTKLQVTDDTACSSIWNPQNIL